MLAEPRTQNPEPSRDTALQRVRCSLKGLLWSLGQRRQVQE